MNNDHVEIEVETAPPPKAKAERIEKTLSCNYKFIPTMNQSIADLVFDLSWDSVNNLLRVGLKENRDFDAFRWFGTINDRHAATQKSSFVDFDADSIMLTFFNSANIELAKMQFRNLKLVSHEVEFGGLKIAASLSLDSGPLCHHITINYQDCQLFLQEKVDVDDWKYSD